jgi:hypothetical protein
LEEKVMGTHDREAAGIVPDRLQRQRSRVRVQCRRVDDHGIDAALSISRIASAGVKCVTGQCD